MSEEFAARIKTLYDEVVAENAEMHKLIFPQVFGDGEYVGQYSDNSASEIRDLGRRMDLPAGSSVLDVGCGTAGVACFLAEELGWRITGIDLSEVSLAAARERVAAKGLGERVRLLQGNVYLHDFGEPFDGAYGTGAFCHFDATALFGRCREILRPEGALGFMERTRLGELSDEEMARLTTEWHCPAVYRLEEYVEVLDRAGFDVRHAVDLTESFRVWQQSSVTAREVLRDEIVRRTSEEYYRISLRLAANENDASVAGKLGYALVVARKR
jgi:cyclopropane fatty-acyl-phospholipid synthase-like methyltransferase